MCLIILCLCVQLICQNLKNFLKLFAFSSCVCVFICGFLCRKSVEKNRLSFKNYVSILNKLSKCIEFAVLINIPYTGKTLCVETAL